MSQDTMDQFRRIYFEECAEQVRVAEEGLQALLDGRANAEQINAVFRAVHSIKGGAGAFGFEAVVGFAHEFETVMDAIRSEVLAVDKALAGVLLEANDVLETLLEDAQEQAENSNPDHVQKVRKKLEKYGGNQEQNQTHLEQNWEEDHEVGLFPEALIQQQSEVPEKSCMKRIKISVKPHKDFMQNGNDPRLIFNCLRDIGVLSITCDLSALPENADQFDPYALYLQWNLTLETEETLSHVQEYFEFVDDCSDLTFEEEAFEPLTQPQSEEDKAGGGLSQNAAAKTAKPSQSIRVDLDKIDRLVNLVGEIVITQSMLTEQSKELDAARFSGLLMGVEELSQHMRELQDNVMSIRAQQVGSVFARMPRVVRELMRETGKDIKLVTSGEATEVDKVVLEKLVDPLTHIIRNAIDHGIEDAQTRKKAGKPEVGTVNLSAYHRSGKIIIQVSDDGGGIHRDRVLQKAIERGIVNEGASLSAEEIDNLIFQPGFSTAENISNISGRGVGMDVVKKNITALGGRVSIESTPQKGSKITMSLPLTLAVLDGMVVAAAGQRFVIPLANILESVSPQPHDYKKAAGQPDLYRARDEYVPILNIEDVFGYGSKSRSDEAVHNDLIVLVEEDDRKLAIKVDDVLGQQQVVIKSLETNFAHLPGISAATILGDGMIALILDIADLQSRIGNKISPSFSEQKRRDAA